MNNHMSILAIRVALAYGLEVFTTVSTPAKKKFIMDTFPQLKGKQMLSHFISPTHKISTSCIVSSQRKILAIRVIAHSKI